MGERARVRVRDEISVAALVFPGFGALARCDGDGIGEAAGAGAGASTA